MLRELAELGLSVARDLKARIEKCEDDTVANTLARSFERVSRSVRHCLALEARLLDDGRRRTLEAREAVTETSRVEIARHRTRVREAFERFIFDDPEVEAYGTDYLLRRADERLEREANYADFLETTVEQHLERLRRAMNLLPGRADEPANTIDRTADIPWRSSA